jgi:hypothetical protein
MIMRALIALVGGGAVGGGVAALMASGAPVVPEPASATSCQDAVQAEISEMLRLRDQAVAAERDLFRARIQRAFARSQAREWPSEHHPALQPQALADHLADTLEGHPVELLELDCASFPCVAAMAWEHLPEDQGLLDGGGGRANLPGRLLAAIQGDGVYGDLPSYATGRLDPAGDARSVFAFAFYDPADVIAAKGADPTATRIDGDAIDQIRGRVEASADHWAAGGQR